MGAERPLILGFLLGLLLALIAPQVVSQVQVPLQIADTILPPSAFSATHTMVQSLRNLVKRGACEYKSFLSSPTKLRLSSTSLCSHYPLSFSTSTSKMSTQKSFLDAVKDRRTYYQLNKEAPISDKQISNLVEQAVLHVPSSFNSQSTRLVVLLNKDHEQFWDFVLETLKPLTPEDQFPKTEQKVHGFRAAYGTILFYEDPEPVENLRKSFPLYAHHFGDWSEHTNAMHQYALWVALEAENFGANLQHYNPIIDQKVAQHWNVPLEYKLRAQLVFGGRAGQPFEKKFQETFGKRLWIHGAKE